MLFSLTRLVDYCAMAVTLWLAFYLLARGYPGRVALRAVVVLLALSAFFFSAFLNLFVQIERTTALRAVLLIVGMATWYNLTYQLLSTQVQKRLRWFGSGLYIFCGITAIILISRSDSFVNERENLLWVGRMGVGFPYVVYGVLQLLAGGGILYNLLTDTKIGLKPQGRYLLLASLFPMAAVGYGILALALTPPMPRLVQDLLIFSGVFLLGAAVARDQMLVERRTTLPDFLISGLTLLGLAGIYTILVWRWGLRPALVAAVTVLAILTHSIYDLIREVLERQRYRSQSTVRRQLSQLEREGPGKARLQDCLQDGLDLLCQTLNASGGFIAIRQDGNYWVAASQQAIPIGSELQASEVICEDVSQPNTLRLRDITWIAPVFEADRQIAIIGLGHPKNRLNYSADDLDLLGEVAERVGTIVSLSNAYSARGETLKQLISEVDSTSSDLRYRADEMMATMAINPDPELIKMVEEGLRHLPDYITLGELSLAYWAGVSGESHIERGKKLQQFLIDAIESLRPAGPRPKEPLPRVWYNYAVLHDAYVEYVPNREIMARLYISEGTFNRTRRSALRGLARLFLERDQVISKA